MLIGVFATLLGVALHLAGAVASSRANTGEPMPMVWGQHPKRPSREIRRLHAAGWIASVLGALAIGDAMWDSKPGASIAIVVALLVLTNGLPSLIVTALHNRRVPS